MDTEQQIRLNFLDEAEEYFDCMESNLLGLAEKEIDPQQVDLVLRSAHSVKGGAAMMGFNVLSGVAHRLEDFLKILRVRYGASQVATEVETLLLQGVDSLRHISALNRHDSEVNESEVNEHTQPIFDQLREYLGDLEAADENALLSQDEDFDPAVLIFEEGVEGVLDRFEAQLSELDITGLTQVLNSTAQELIGFGNMASLEPFIQLCESIQQQVASISPSEIETLAEKALKTWRRSYALVLRGSIEKLPSNIEGYELEHPNPINPSVELENQELLGDSFVEEEFDPLEADSLELSSLKSAFELETPPTESEAEFDPLEADSLELNGLQSAVELETPETETESDFDLLDVDSLELSGLQSAFALETPETESRDYSDADSVALSNSPSALELENFEDASTTIPSEISPPDDSAAKSSTIDTAGGKDGQSSCISN